MKYAGWWRCRIRGRVQKYPWLYFFVETNSKRDFRAKARFAAQLHLRRMVCDCERVAFKPSTLQRVATTDGVAFFADTTFSVTPVPAVVEVAR